MDISLVIVTVMTMLLGFILQLTYTWTGRKSGGLYVSSWILLSSALAAMLCTLMFTLMSL
jgi:hypothetical protein